MSNWVFSDSDFEAAQHSLNSFPPECESRLEFQTQPHLPLQSHQQLVGLDLQNCHQQILLLSATDVLDTLVLRLNHFSEEWKELHGHGFDPSIPLSYSDMVYKLRNSQRDPLLKRAMLYAESAYLRDLEKRGYDHAIERQGELRQDVIAFLTKAKGEGGRNDVAHPFSTSVNQYWKSPSQTPGKVRFLLGTAVDGLTQSQKDWKLRILDVLSNSQNVPECYHDLAQVAFPLQIFFLRDVIAKSKVTVEVVGVQ